MRDPAIVLPWPRSTNAPIYVSGEVWEEVEDMAEVLRKIEEEDYESRESDEEW